MPVRLFVKILDSRAAERELRRLLKRHRDKVLAVAVVLSADNEKQVAILARHYRLRLAPIPATILLPVDRERSGSKE